MQVTKDVKMHKKAMENANLDANRWVKAWSGRCSKGQSRCSENHSRCNKRQSCCSDEPIDQMETIKSKACSLQRKYTVLTLLEHKTPDKKRGATTIWEISKEGWLREHFREGKHLENHFSLEILTKIEEERPRNQTLTRISTFVVYFLHF